MATVTPPMSTSQFVNALDRGINKHFKDTFEAKKPKVESIFKVSDREDYNQEEMDYTGFGPMALTPEGQKFPIDSQLEGFKTTYTGVKYTSSVQITKEMIKFDKARLSDAKNIGSEQAKQVVRAMEKQGASVFNNGFNPSFTSYGDGKPFFSIAHTRADGGGNRSNASASGITLTHDNLETAIVAMRNQVNHRGELIEIQPKILLVPNELEQEALVITKSTNRSGTADNDVNAYGMREYYGGKLKIIVWDYLTSATAWFLCDPDNNRLEWKWGWKPVIADFDEYTGKQNDTFYWYVSYEAATGWGDPVAWYGSKGDGQPYAS